MRIESIEIDGFGHFAGCAFGPLAGGITIVQGPNGAGKSTLHAFIRAILFGFPEPGSPEWIPALAGGRHGGRLVLRDATGARFVVERHSDHACGVARVSGASGQAGDQALCELLGNIGGEAYRAIFAFGRDDLCSLDLLPPELLADGDFMSIASETDPADACLQPVAEILRELEALDRELAVPTSGVSGHALRGRRTELAAEIEAAERKLAALESLQRRLVTFERARDAAQAQVDAAQGELAGIEAAIERLRQSVPDDPGWREARKLRRQIDELRETWTRLQAICRMTEVYEQTVARQSMPREPVFLGALAAGALLPLIIGLVTGQAVVAAIGVASAVLGAVMLVLALIARSRFDTAQAQARFQLELTQRDAEARYLHAALAAGIDADDVHTGLERLTGELAALEAAQRARDELRALEDERSYQRARFERARADLEAAMAALDEASAAWPPLAAELGVDPGPGPEAAREAIERARDQLLVERGRLDQRIEQLDAEQRGSALRLRREALLAALREHARDLAGSVTAQRLLREALCHANGGQSAALREAGALLEAMTSGAYHRLERAGGSGALLAVARDGSRAPLDQLSRGAREQAYLALRLGLIKEFGQRVTPLPVLVDDALVNLDPERATETLRALISLAATHQVLLFTCHPAIVALARFVHPAAAVVELGRQRVAGLDPVWLDND